jgi:hypothetical protein
MNRLLKLITLALFSIPFTRPAVLFRQADDLPQEVEYDFIIAGG